MTQQKTTRRDAILQTLAEMLESNPGQRVTTAALAAQVGVSEAALYRHFPSKAKMFEALIEFVEDTLFSRIRLIVTDEPLAQDKCEKILALILTFAARNPGLCRLLTGDALTGENDRLRVRSAQVFERLETQLKQVLRQAEIEEKLLYPQSTSVIANLLLSWVEGRIIQFVRSGFKQAPNAMWQEQWTLLSAQLFQPERLALMTE